MKLTTRFFLSHGGMVFLTLLISFLFIYEGARILYQRQSRLSQQQQFSDFALAARESLAQREDVAVLNFMKAAARDPLVIYSSYSNFLSGTHILYPQTLERELSTVGKKESPENHSPDNPASPEAFKLADGREIVEWASALRMDGKIAGLVRLGYSQAAIERDLSQQTAKWTRMELAAGLAALLLGLGVSLGLGRQMAAPLKKISEGTHLVRSGKLDSLVEVNRDDEIGDLARDFNAMVSQLRELDEMKRDFMAGVTHDLGTPLHAIRSAINYLQAGDAGPLTEKQAEYLLMVSNSTSNLTAFINNLLTTARIEAAKVEPYPEPLDVFALVKEMVDLYQPQAEEKGLKLSLIRKGPYVSLVADVTMFRQIVLNLLSNALKFTLQGKVDVFLSEESGDFVLEVRDTGIGVDPKDHQMIFEKFFRVQQPASSPMRQGSGLGLTIVKGLAEAQEGKVEVKSGLGRGSLFKVSLPKQPRRF